MNAVIPYNLSPSRDPLPSFRWESPLVVIVPRGVNRRAR